jgi:hypothetical protein
MKHLLIYLFWLFFANISFSQQESKILNNAVLLYENYLPKLENEAFKKYIKLNNVKIKKRELSNGDYHLIIISTYKLNDNYKQFREGEKFEQYIDFGKIHNSFDIFIFKDSIYQGYLFLSDLGCGYFSVVDTNMYNASTFKSHSAFAKQILQLNPDLCFYPECPLFICLVKEGKLYIGKWEHQLSPIQLLPFKDFIIINPSFIEELVNNKDPSSNDFRQLKN